MKDIGKRIQTEDSDNGIAIKVEHVSKTFRLPHNRQNSLKGSLINLVKGGDRAYEKQEVLKDVSFEIKKGEFFGIVGRNGSGKSTLLKMLAGIYKPTKGKITVNGSLTPFIELGVGFNPELTGRENVFLNGALLGFNREDMNAMYDDIVSFAELERFMDQKLKNYSSGMQVRLAFSIAIRAQSNILLLDEVLAVGDAAFQAKCFDYFYELKKNKATVIFVSHDRGSLERFCTNGILIDQGEIITEGKITKVLDAYTDVVLSQMNGSALRSDDAPAEPREDAVILKKVRIYNRANDENVKTADFNDRLAAEIEITFKQQAENPIIGATLWKVGIENTAVYACNNLTEGLGEMGVVETGETVRYSFFIPQGINDGEYMIEVGIANSSATHFLMQKRNAARFKVFGSHNPHALLANSADLKIKKS